MLKDKISSLNLSRDQEIKNKINKLVKPTRDSKFFLIIKIIFWWIALICSLPLILFPIVGWFGTIVMILALIAYYPSSKEVEKKFQNSMSSYNKKITNIKSQAREKYNDLILLEIENDKQEALAAKAGLTLDEYNKRESEKKIAKSLRLEKKISKENLLKKQAAKEEYASWLNGSNEEKLLAKAASIVVQYQSASTSLIQRKLKLGYNKASSIMEILEDVGIVGPFNYPESRKVIFSDLIDLLE
tara:strand:+ start:77 stop:808 length:732 start_codon:yes stop_codon:yes gene_type:complete